MKSMCIYPESSGSTMKGKYSELNKSCLAQRDIDQQSKVPLENDSVTTCREELLRKQVSSQSLYMDKLHEQLTQALLKIQNLEYVVHSLEDQLVEAKSEMQQLELEKSSALKQLDFSIANIDLAILEKRKAQAQGTYATNEVDILESTISKLIDEAGRKTKEKVESVTQNYNANIDQLLHEVHTLNLAARENDLLNEKTRKERTRILQKLRQVQDELASKHGNHQDMCTAALKRITELEQQLDVTFSKLDAMEIKLAARKPDDDRRLHLLQELISELVSQVESLTSEKEQLALEKLTITRANAQLEHRLQVTVSDSAGKEDSKSQIELLQLQHQMQLKEQESNTHREMMEESHYLAIENFKKQLKFKQNLAERWRTDAEKALSNYQNKIRFLEQQVVYWKNFASR